MNYREILIDAFFEAIRSVQPENLIKENLSVKDGKLRVQEDEYPLKKFYIFGSGKASVEMAKAFEKYFFEYIIGGTVVCNYEENLKKITVIKGSHPIPDENSLKGAEALIQQISSLKENELFIYLLSGGSSALIEKPIPPITIEDLRLTTQILLRSGATIDEINIVRKHISMIKGGRLGRLTKATGIVLVISDVVGDDLETIGSAPLYFDRYTYEDTFNILEKYEILEKIPKSVRKVVEKGLKGEIDDTPKKPPENIKHYIIGNNLRALKGAKSHLEKKNIKSYIITSQIEGEARDVAKAIASIGLEIKNNNADFKPPCCLLFGGETTVTVRGSGKGGRNQELVLSAVQKIKDRCGIYILSCGTDGIDGVTDVAGVIADCNVYEKAEKEGLDIDKFLKNNDSYTFFEKTGGLIKTGYTGTNVMDIIMLLVEE